MIKKLALIICFLLVVLHLGGCQLAKADGGGANANDRMIGVFITQEHLDLFDFESYFSDNVSSILMSGEVKAGADSDKYNKRIYATQKRSTSTGENGETYENLDYVFEGVEGVPFLIATTIGASGESYQSVSASEGLHDVHVTSGDKIILEGTIYVTPKAHDSFIGMYVNPVYQSADGEVYLTAGTGTSFSGDMSEGMEASQTITSTEKTTDENGEVVEYSFEAKVRLAVRYPATSVTIIEMGKGNTVLGNIKYSVVDLPSEFSVGSDTEFIILEERVTKPAGDSIKRQILERENNSFTVLAAGEGGLCEGHYVELRW